MIVKATAAAAALMLFPLVAEGADLQKKDAATTVSQQSDEKPYGDFRDTLHDWKLTIGGGALYQPEYEGSDKFDINPMPLFSAQFGDRLYVDVTGVRYDLIQWRGFKLSAKGGYEMGRKEDDSDYLRGLGDVDFGGVIGGIASYSAGPFEIYGALNKTLGGSEGLTGTAGVKASRSYGRFHFSGDVSATWADDNYMESYFGVTSAQSARSGLRQYNAEAGLKRIDLKTSVTYMLTDNWLLTGAAGVGFLQGDAKDSPIVKDDVQPFVLLGIGYKF